MEPSQLQVSSIPDQMSIPADLSTFRERLSWICDQKNRDINDFLMPIYAPQKGEPKFKVYCRICKKMLSAAYESISSHWVAEEEHMKRVADELGVDYESLKPGVRECICGNEPISLQVSGELHMDICPMANKPADYIIPTRSMRGILDLADPIPRTSSPESGTPIIELDDETIDLFEATQDDAGNFPGIRVLRVVMLCAAGDQSTYTTDSAGTSEYARTCHF